MLSSGWFTEVSAVSFRSISRGLSERQNGLPLGASPLRDRSSVAPPGEAPRGRGSRLCPPSATPHRATPGPPGAGQADGQHP